MNEDFKPGLYRHYKGGLYTAICLVTHHETRKPMVLYMSHTYGGLSVRPLRGWDGDKDGWIGMVFIPVSCDPNEKLGRHVPRFGYVGPLPSDTPIGER